MESFGITITAQLRHGDLWQAAKKLGGNSALARLLDMHPSTIGEWINLKRVPVHPLSEDKQDTLLKLTGKTVAELWPDELKQAMAQGPLLTKIEEHRNVALRRLAQNANDRLMLPSPEDIAAKSEIVERCLDVLKTLKPRHKQVLELRFGLNGEKPSSLEETGKAMNITKERVRQLEYTAIRKMEERKDEIGNYKEIREVIDA